MLFEGLMNYNFRSYNPEQPYLLPPSLDDWLPQDHLARFISETVDQMDLSALITAYRANGQGSAAYHPAMMVKILLSVSRKSYQPKISIRPNFGLMPLWTFWKC
ncbi:MAG: hypothetical protein C4B57_02895 [Deltaproteobacteria bacterium]|nr:MAG: hypothetical protein C4B57_02895 [Deltaproteobacteria bacterium]